MKSIFISKIGVLHILRLFKKTNKQKQTIFWFIDCCPKRDPNDEKGSNPPKYKIKVQREIQEIYDRVTKLITLLQIQSNDK